MKQENNFFGKMSSYFIDRYRIVYLMLLAIMLIGSISYLQLPREEMPEVPMPIVAINTINIGIAPSEMEEMITEVVETSISKVDGIKNIRSMTSTGVSTVLLILDEDADMRDVVADVNTEINNIKPNLPNDAMDPIVMTVNSSDMPVMNITLSGEYTLVELKQYADQLQLEIEAIRGVEEVEIYGGLEPVITVYIDKDKMEEYGLHINGVAQSIDSNNKDRSVGSTELDTLEYSVKVMGKLESPEQIEDIMVGNADGNPIYLKDIGYVQVEYEEAESIANVYDAEFGGEKIMTPTVSMRVMREAGADVIGISEQIREILEESKGAIYPEDVNISIANDSAANVEQALNDVIENALSGLLIVIVVLFIFIGFRESLIVAVVIPLSLMMAFMGMLLGGITLNTLSLVGLIVALGMLVDNAIVIIESIDRARDEGLNVIEASKSAANQVGPAVFSATLTTMAAFLPMAMMSGTMGAFMSVLPKVVIFAIGASFVISIVITPTLCSRFLAKKKTYKRLPIVIRIISVILVGVLTGYAFGDSGIGLYAIIVFSGTMFIKMFLVKQQQEGSDNSIKRVYSSILTKIINQKIVMVAIIVACIVLFVNSLMIVFTGKIDLELMPEGESTTISIQGEMPVGYLLDDALEIATQIEEKVFEYDEVISIGSNVNKSSIDITLEVVDEDERTRSMNELVESLRADVSMIPGAKITVSVPTAMEAAMGMSGGMSPISVKVIGENGEDVERVTEDLTQIMQQVEGTTEVSSSMGNATPELQIIVDKEKAALYGLSVDVITATVYQLISPTGATEMTIDGTEIDVKLKYEQTKLNSIADFSDIIFTTQVGKVSFDEVAHVEEVMSAAMISRENLERVESVNSNVVSGYNTVRVVNEFEERIADYEMPAGVRISYGGEMEQLTELFTSLAISMVIAIILVLIILTIQFNSLTQPLMILCAVPLAIIGSINGLLLTGNNFGGFSFLGIVALVGIAINNAIVLVDYANYLRREEGMELKEAVVEAGKSRLVSVLSTTITTIGGILPLSLKDPVYAQLGYALIYGLLAATVLTLVVIPILYYIFESMKIKIRKRVPILVDER